MLFTLPMMNDKADLQSIIVDPMNNHCHSDLCVTTPNCSSDIRVTR
jgi:hypothetical protein